MWPMKEATQRFKTATEIDVWRQTAESFKRGRTLDRRVRKLMGIRSAITYGIRNKQLTWFRHIQLMVVNKLQKQILTCNPKE